MTTPHQPHRSNDPNDVFARPPPTTEPRQVQPAHPLEPPPSPVSQKRAPTFAATQLTPPRFALPSSIRNEPPKTLDDLADQFLRGPSARTERGLSPILKPSPLQATDDFKRLQTFVSRRAWGNAVATANQLLHGQRDASQQLIPWSLHITAAVASRDLDALWAIRKALIESEENFDQKKALYMVENAIANAAGTDWRLVLAALERMLKLSKDRSVDILSRQGRVLLQAGAIKEAKIIFDRAAAQDQQLMYERPFDKAQVLVNSGMLAFSEGSFEESWDSLKKAIQILRTLMYERREENAMTECADLYGEAMNNMALAALYLCRLDDALQLMESLVREDVTLFLTDRIATNLCTLYELASDSNVSNRKKQVLQLIAQRFSLHDIKAECFRVNH